MKLVFLHGWAFDRTAWSGMADAFDALSWDRGYFGAPFEEEPEAYVAVGHSLGAMLLAARASPRCRGLVAINGFDRFAARGDRPGVALRTIDHMIRRLEVAPADVLDGFRARCGAGPAPAQPDIERLAADLRLLREADAGAAWTKPLLALDGASDWLLSPAHRAQSFADAPLLERTTHAGGHDLPWSHPAWCTDRIRGFVAGLA